MLKNKPTDTSSSDDLSYTAKVWQAVAIVALLVLTILVARVAFNVLLMIMSGALISVFFHGLGDTIQRHTPLSRKWAMTVSVAGTIILFGVMVWFMGTKIQVQIAQLSNSLPGTINSARAKLSETSFGQKILDGLSSDDPHKMMSTAQSFFSTGFGVLGDIYIIIFLGIFFTSNPSVYKNGILLLIPDRNKDMGKHIIDRISISLKGWLKSTLLSMVLITIMITVGLSIMHVPVAFILALITGLLKLIPNLGSFIAMIPGVLLALTMGTQTAIIVALIYIVSQTIVSNIITPLIQSKIINLPPALTLISQLIMGSLTGVLGIILAVPLVAIVVILVDELYVKKVNNPAVEKNLEQTKPLE